MGDYVSDINGETYPDPFPANVHPGPVFPMGTEEAWWAVGPSASHSPAPTAWVQAETKNVRLYCCPVCECFVSRHMWKVHHQGLGCKSTSERIARGEPISYSEAAKVRYWPAGTMVSLPRKKSLTNAPPSYLRSHIPPDYFKTKPTKRKTNGVAPRNRAVPNGTLVNYDPDDMGQLLSQVFPSVRVGDPLFSEILEWADLTRELLGKLGQK